MHRSKEDDQKDHFEKHQKYVTLRKHQSNATEDRADRSLENRHAQRIKCLFDAFVWIAMLRRHVSVADVRREIDREADAHDQINH